MTGSKPLNETLLGIDYGAANIGLAFGKSGLVAPIKVISGRDTDEAIREIARIALENKVTKIIVGLPLSDKGKETPQSKEVRKFAKLLKIRLKKPLVFVDEYGSSKDVVKPMIGLGISKRRRRQKDHFSAALILRNFYREVS